MNPESIFSFFFTLGFRSGLWSQGKVDYLITEKVCLPVGTYTENTSFLWMEKIYKKETKAEDIKTSTAKIKILR